MFKVTEQREGQGAMGAGTLENPKRATHQFRVTDNEGEPLFAGVTDGQDHDGLRAWVTAAHGRDGGANVEFKQIRGDKDEGRRQGQGGRSGQCLTGSLSTWST